MRGKQHLEFGIVSGTAIAAGLAYTGFLPVIETVPFIGLSMIGSVYPDIDHPESSIGRKIPWLSNFLFKTFGHRTYTHMIFPWILISFGFYFLPKWSWGFMIGIFSHLYLDSLTIKGTPFFIKNEKFKNIHLLPKCLRCRSGSFVSKIYTFMADVSVIALTFLGMIYFSK